MRIHALAALLAAAALISLGCAPTQLGTRELKGSKPLLNDINKYGSAVFRSNGENLSVAITIPPENDLCSGDFKLISSHSAWPVLPGNPSLIYEGAFAGQLSSKCLDLIGHPGGTRMALVVQQSILTDGANIYICEASKRVGDTCFASGVVYTTDIE